MILKLLATLTGIAMSLGYYPQAYRIWKTKSSRDISLAAYAIFAFGTATWLAYGIALRDLTIILSFGLGVVGSWLVLVLSLVYKPKK